MLTPLSRCYFNIAISHQQWLVTMNGQKPGAEAIRITYHPEEAPARAYITTDWKDGNFKMTAPDLDDEKRIICHIKGFRPDGVCCLCMIEDDIEIFGVPKFTKGLGDGIPVRFVRSQEETFFCNNTCIMKLRRSPCALTSGIVKGWIHAKYRELLPYLATYLLAERGLLHLVSPWAPLDLELPELLWPPEPPPLTPQPELVVVTDDMLQRDISLSAVLQDSKLIRTNFCWQTYRVEHSAEPLSGEKEDAVTESLSIPPQVQTEEMLYMYVWSHHPQWLPDWNPPPSGPMGKDHTLYSKSIPWEDGTRAGVEISYIAFRREACCCVWVGEGDDRQEYLLPPLSIPSFVKTREALGKYVFQRKPAWELKEEQPLCRDFQLHVESISMVNGHAGSSVSYKHMQRVVVCEKWCVTGPRQGPVTHEDSTEELRIPPQIQTKRQLKRYVNEKTFWMRGTLDSYDPWGVLGD